MRKSATTELSSLIFNFKWKSLSNSAAILTVCTHGAGKSSAGSAAALADVILTWEPSFTLSFLICCIWVLAFTQITLLGLDPFPVVCHTQQDYWHLAYINVARFPPQQICHWLGSCSIIDTLSKHSHLSDLEYYQWTVTSESYSLNQISL